jgi:hypothetical protein
MRGAASTGPEPTHVGEDRMRSGNEAAELRSQRLAQALTSQPGGT